MISNEKMIDIEEFYKDIRVEINSIATPLIEHAIRESLIEFCQKTKYWRRQLQPFIAPNDLSDIEIRTPKGTSLDEVLLATFDDNGIDRELQYFGIDHFQAEFPKRGDRAPREPFYFQRNKKNIAVGPSDRLYQNEVTLVVSLKPDRESTEVIQSIYDDHRKTILCGARHYLYSLPGKEWTDLNLANYHLQMFQDGCGKANRESSRGYSSFRRPGRVSRRFYI